MAGIRQHYLPRFLLKGFVSKTNKQEKYTFVFPKDGKPYETNLINIGLEKYFYGTPKNSETDDAITSEEEKYVSFVEEIRTLDRTSQVDQFKSHSFITHLVFRAKHIRESIVEVQSKAFRAIQNNIKDKNPQEIFYDYIQTNKDRFAKALRKNLSKSLNPFETEIGVQFALKNPKFLSSNLPPEFQKDTLQWIEWMIEDTPKNAKTGHNEALKKSLEPNNFLKHSKNFKWETVYRKNQNLVLGDVGPVGVFGPKLVYKSLLFEMDNLSQILLPISSSHILIGTSPDSPCSIPDEKTINQSVASLSRSFIISKVNTEKVLMLSSIIGSLSSILDENGDGKLDETIRKGLFGK